MKGKSTLPRKLRKNMLRQTCQNVAFLKTLFIKNYLFLLIFLQNSWTMCIYCNEYLSHCNITCHFPKRL